MQLASSRRAQANASRSARTTTRYRRRRVFFETLEARTVLAPFGAFPDDTGEYMLGDVLVTVVLMESDPTLPGADLNTEDWTPESIAAVQDKVQTAMNWWKETLASADQFYYNPELPLLDFKYDWTWTLNPVRTPYEPINRYTSYHELWINDFLTQPDVNFAQSLDIYKDVKAFNNFQREKYNTDWAFTIFVVNSTADEDDLFPKNPSPAPGEISYQGAFAFLGGQFLVVPSDRPTMTFAHETGHIFYALDEYSTGHSYYLKSGYYNTQNTNGIRENPVPGFVGLQQPSIMATGTAQSIAWQQFITSDSSMAAIGWLDSDGDGVMDVLDVPFSLKGKGTYDPVTGEYRFEGTSTVRTLPNKNTFGSQHSNLVYNDISINKIRRVEYSIDGGEWTTIKEFDNPGYSSSFEVTVTGLTPGPHSIRFRTFDHRTGAASEEFVGTITPENQSTPPQLSQYAGAITGFAYRDTNGNGQWDPDESPLSGWTVELRNIDDEPLILSQTIEPDDYEENTILNSIKPGVTLSVIGATAEGGLVMSRTSIRGVGKVFYAGSTASETFATIRTPSGTSLATDRRLKIDFSVPVSAVSLKAISAALDGQTKSVGRLDAYDTHGNLVGRYTTGALGIGASEVMTITRPAADIKYVIASSHLETEVLFDSLVIGPATSTTTNADGSFEITALPPGQYNVKILTKPNYIPGSPLDEMRTVSVQPDSTDANNLYFGFQFTGNPWHNVDSPLDVNGVGGITAFDALLVINYLNLHPETSLLVASEAQPNYYIDVNNDNQCTAFDALVVINWLNLHFSSGGEPQAPPGDNPFPGPTDTDIINGSTGGGDSGGEGANVPEVAQTAQQYFAAAPLHISHRFKDDSHVHFDGDHHHDHDHVGAVSAFDDSTTLGADWGIDFSLPLDQGGLASTASAGEATDPEFALRGAGSDFIASLSPLLDRLRTLRVTKESDEESADESPNAVSDSSNLYDLLAVDQEQLARCQ
jgi:hypothetical protein